MSTAISPLYTVTESYLDVVEKGQRVVVDLVETVASRIHDLTPDQVGGLLAKVAPKPADLDRGYALVSRAVSLQQSFARDLAQAVAGSETPVAAAKSKRAA